jgi:hypothetical protein
MIRRAATFLALTALLLQSHLAANACGPSYLEPIFVFETSPDLPFEDYAAGKIGIVKPSFGRKTLVIAYRYLNGGSFSPDEQKQLISALEGAPPDADDDAQALKVWIALRKEITPAEELPEIYRDRKTPFGGYDYFPNCASNAFEVATATLKDRLASYGSDDPNTREWVRGQDEVFQNCSGGEPTIPRELGAGVPGWLRQDREYQIGAALFYSLQFDEAVARFERIAADVESPWQSTAEYLVARALVRQASLAGDQNKKAAVYAKAENQLQKLINGNSKFSGASRKLAGLLKYRIHPEARVMELAEIVSRAGSSLDLRQDLIDYVWLLARFETQALKQEHARREALKPKENREERQSISRTVDSVYEAVQRGELISITVAPQFADGTYDYGNLISIQVKPDTPEAEILRLAAERFNRPLTDEEAERVRSQIKSGLQHRRWVNSYNLKVSQAADEYETCYSCNEVELTLPLVPAFLLGSDLTDWILTLELEGPETYAHAVAKWCETESPAWLIAALTKAESNSSEVRRLIGAAERVSSDSPAYPSIVFHLVRLKMAGGQIKQAQELLDKITATQFDLLPVSARNEFQAMQLKLAPNLANFLKYSARKPVAFYQEGIFVSIRDLIESQKSFLAEYEPERPKEEYAKQLELQYQDLLVDDVRLFDQQAADIVDRHFSLQLLQQAASDPQLSVYLRHRLTLAVWARALLLNKREVAVRVAPEVIKIAPETAPLVTAYLEARNSAERDHAALYLLLKSPGLTPFISANLPQTSVTEDLDYYFEIAWWCEPSKTEYRNGEEGPKKVMPPAFLDARQLDVAKHEYDQLAGVGNAASYLGKKVLEWARTSADDERIPEALFIAFRANEGYKYGCTGWSRDEEIQAQAAQLLNERYPSSPWTAKLPRPDDK